MSYGMPTFKLKGKNLVHFASFKGAVQKVRRSSLDSFHNAAFAHRFNETGANARAVSEVTNFRDCSIYPLPQAIAAFADELEPYPHAKGSIQFPHGEPLPLDLVRRIVERRVSDVNEAQGRRSWR
jgi:uncharacterized protein YdhG (YjbR/CyaY superfamily)